MAGTQIFLKNGLLNSGATAGALLLLVLMADRAAGDFGPPTCRYVGREFTANSDYDDLKAGCSGLALSSTFSIFFSLREGADSGNGYALRFYDPADSGATQLNVWLNLNTKTLLVTFCSISPCSQGRPGYHELTTPPILETYANDQFLFTADLNEITLSMNGKLLERLAIDAPMPALERTSLVGGDGTENFPGYVFDVIIFDSEVVSWHYFWVEKDCRLPDQNFDYDTVEAVDSCQDDIFGGPVSIAFTIELGYYSSNVNENTFISLELATPHSHRYGSHAGSPLDWLRIRSTVDGGVEVRRDHFYGAEGCSTPGSIYDKRHRFLITWDDKGSFQGWMDGEQWCDYRTPYPFANGLMPEKRRLVLGGDNFEGKLEELWVFRDVVNWTYAAWETTSTTTTVTTTTVPLCLETERAFEYVGRQFKADGDFHNLRENCSNLEVSGTFSIFFSLRPGSGLGFTDGYAMRFYDPADAGAARLDLWFVYGEKKLKVIFCPQPPCGSGSPGLYEISSPEIFAWGQADHFLLTADQSELSLSMNSELLHRVAIAVPLPSAERRMVVGGDATASFPGWVHDVRIFPGEVMSWQYFWDVKDCYFPGATFNGGAPINVVSSCQDAYFGGGTSFAFTLKVDSLSALPPDSVLSLELAHEDHTLSSVDPLRVRVLADGKLDIRRSYGYGPEGCSTPGSIVGEQHRFLVTFDDKGNYQGWTDGEQWCDFRTADSGMMHSFIPKERKLLLGGFTGTMEELWVFRAVVNWTYAVITTTTTTSSSSLSSTSSSSTSLSSSSSSSTSLSSTSSSSSSSSTGSSSSSSTSSSSSSSSSRSSTSTSSSSSVSSSSTTGSSTTLTGTSTSATSTTSFTGTSSSTASVTGTKTTSTSTASTVTVTTDRWSTSTTPTAGATTSYMETTLASDAQVETTSANAHMETTRAADAQMETTWAADVHAETTLAADARAVGATAPTTTAAVPTTTAAAVAPRTTATEASSAAAGTTAEAESGAAPVEAREAAPVEGTTTEEEVGGTVLLELEIEGVDVRALQGNAAVSAAVVSALEKGLVMTAAALQLRPSALHTTLQEGAGGTGLMAVTAITDSSPAMATGLMKLCQVLAEAVRSEVNEVPGLKEGVLAPGAAVAVASVGVSGAASRGGCRVAELAEEAAAELAAAAAADLLSRLAASNETSLDAFDGAIFATKLSPLVPSSSGKLHVRVPVTGGAGAASELEVRLPLQTVRDLERQLTAGDELAVVVRPILDTSAMGFGGVLGAAVIDVAGLVGGTNLDTGRLAAPIEFSLPAAFVPRMACAFWDESQKRWSTAGVAVSENSTEGRPIWCKTWHLSLFGAILQGFTEAFLCSNFQLFTADAISELFQGEWLATPGAVLFWILLSGLFSLFAAAALLDYKRSQRFVWRSDFFLIPTDLPPAVAPEAGGGDAAEEGPQEESESRGCLHRCCSSIVGCITATVVCCKESAMKDAMDEVASSYFEMFSEMRDIVEGIWEGLEISAVGAGRLFKLSHQVMQQLVMNSSRHLVGATLGMSGQVVSFVLADKDLSELLMRRHDRLIARESLARASSSISEGGVVANRPRVPRRYCSRSCLEGEGDPLRSNGSMLLDEKASEASRPGHEGNFQGCRPSFQQQQLTASRSDLAAPRSRSGLSDAGTSKVNPQGGSRWWGIANREDAWAALHGEICEVMERHVSEHSARCHVPRTIMGIFLVHNPIGNILSINIFMSCKMRSLFRAMNLLGDIMVVCIFYSASGSVKGKQGGEAGSECFDEDLEEETSYKAGRILAIAMGSVILGGVPVSLLQSFHTRSFKKLPSEGCKEWQRQLAAWRAQDRIIWVLGSLYLAFGAFFVALFLANISGDDHEEWTSAGTMSLIQDAVILPLGIAFVMPMLASVFLVCVSLAGNVGTNSLLRDVHNSLYNRTNAMLPIACI